MPLKDLKMPVKLKMKGQKMPSMTILITSLKLKLNTQSLKMIPRGAVLVSGRNL